LDDKIQAGYREHSESAGAATWLDAWADVLRLCDAAGARSIEGFDDRFPMTQSLYNWSQDLEEALWNAGLDDREKLLARIAVCEEALRRFRDEDQLMTENRRRALAESYFEVGKTGKAEDLFQSWLAADPRWGFGWIGWAACHVPRAGRFKNYGRAEELLRRGYSTPGVRDREAIAEWLQILCKETGRLRSRSSPLHSLAVVAKAAAVHERTSHFFSGERALAQLLQAAAVQVEAEAAQLVQELFVAQVLSTGAQQPVAALYQAATGSSRPRASPLHRFGQE
jgi:tetratricopeptide (TPR) repeat protein